MMNNRNQHSTLYISDLDGTLLDGTSRISHTSAAILSRLAENGVMITPATARTPATVQPLLRNVAQSYYIDPASAERNPLPAIVMTGAALWNRQDKRYESCILVPEEDAGRIMDTFRSMQIHPFIYCLSGDHFLNVYHPAVMSRREDAFYQERRHLELKRFHLDQYPADLGRVVLFFAIGPVGLIKSVSERLRLVTDCATAWYPDVILPETGLIDSYAPGVSKASAVKTLAAKVGAERTVVFGDNLNDIPMMQVASEAVAVENALAQVKDIATTVIGPNTADAVPRFIASREGIDISDLL